MNVYRNPLLDVAPFDRSKEASSTTSSGGSIMVRMDGCEGDPLALPGFFGNDPFLHYMPIGAIPGVLSRFHFGFSSYIWKDDGTPVATTAGDPMAPTRSYTGEMADHNQFDAQFFVVLDGEFLAHRAEDHAATDSGPALIAFEDDKLKAFADSDAQCDRRATWRTIPRDSTWPSSPANVPAATPSRVARNSSAGAWRSSFPRTAPAAWANRTASER